MTVDPAELGYVFYPFSDGFSIGYAELDVFVGDSAHAEGFVPSQIVVCTWNGGNLDREPDGLPAGAPGTGPGTGSGTGPANGLSSGPVMGRITIAAHTAVPAEGETVHKVAPGFVTVEDKNGGALNAYCFGGHLAARQAGSVVACRLTSPAPILNLSEEGLDWSDNGILRVVDGLESELATLRAAVEGDQETAFDQRLAKTDPRLLYAAGLDLAYRSFQALPEALRTEHYWDEYSVLVRAQQEARQSAWWPDDPSLPAVLGRAQ